jgi:hypothetical protein
MVLKRSTLSGGGSSGTPFGDSASRPSSPAVGTTYYNGELGYLEIYNSTAGWIPASSGNDFNLNIVGTYTTSTLAKAAAAGSYAITSSLSDYSYDMYAYDSDGTLAGYTKTPTLTATSSFTKVVVLGGTSGDLLSFSYKTTYNSTNTTSEVTAAPFITSVSGTALNNINNSVTVNGGNFATDVAVAFTGTGYSSTAAKSIVRSSAAQLIVTRPDNFPPSASPYTITITNPGVTAPTGTNAHILTNAVTAGTIPSWSTSTTLPVYTRNVPYSTTVAASDSELSTMTYSYVSGTLPDGLSLASNGTISGTPTVLTSHTYTVRVTDAGGNYVDRTFTLNNVGPNAPTWVTSGSLTSATWSASYSYQLSATDDSGAAPTYSIVSGSLPTGLSMSSSGLISGTTGSSAAPTTFVVRATDANGLFTNSSTLTLPTQAWNFTGSYTFTSSRTVPANAGGNYVGNYYGAQQSFIIPSTGTYRITGAAYGQASVSYTNAPVLQADFSLTTGQRLVVTLSGSGGGARYSSGGGATYVGIQNAGAAGDTTRSNWTPLLVSGGAASSNGITQNITAYETDPAAGGTGGGGRTVDGSGGGGFFTNALNYAQGFLQGSDGSGSFGAGVGFGGSGSFPADDGDGASGGGGGYTGGSGGTAAGSAGSNFLLNTSTNKSISGATVSPSYVTITRL